MNERPPSGPGVSRMLDRNQGIMIRTAVLAGLMTLASVYLTITGKSSMAFWLVAGLGWVIVGIMYVARRRDLVNHQAELDAEKRQRGR